MTEASVYGRRVSVSGCRVAELGQLIPHIEPNDTI